MMNNKKYFKIGAAVVLSGILLITAVLTSYASSNAYEELKALMREHRAQDGQINSMTVHMEMDITDNGESVLRIAGDMKTADDRKNKSGQFIVLKEGVEKAFEVYSKDDTTLFRLDGSGNWYQTASNEEYPKEEGRFSRSRDKEDMNVNIQLRESVMDAIMGDLKDQISLSESNGLRTFSLTLDKGNMPVLVQTLFSASQLRDDSKCSKADRMKNLPVELQNEIVGIIPCDDFTKITSNRVLEEMKISITVDEKNQPQNMGLSMKFSGNDEDGVAHVIEADCRMTLSDISTTIPDEVNVDPSLVTTIEKNESKRFGSRH